MSALTIILDHVAPRAYDAADIAFLRSFDQAPSRAVPFSTAITKSYLIERRNKTLLGIPQSDWDKVPVDKRYQLIMDTLNKGKFQPGMAIQYQTDTQKAQQAAAQKSGNAHALLAASVTSGASSIAQDESRASLVYNGQFARAEHLFPGTIKTKKGFGSPARFRFKTVDGKKVWKPWNKDELTDLVLHFQARENNEVDDNRAMDYVNEYMGKQNELVKKYPLTDSRVVFPWYSFQTVDHKKQSWWVKNRDKVAGVVLAVAAVYLGPAVYAKVASGIGKVAGAVTGTGAAAGTAASSAASTAATGSGWLASAQAAIPGIVSKVNDARALAAIAQGKMPPPPISLEGDSFTEWAFNLARDELVQQYGEKLTREQENQLRKEIEAMQNEMAAVTPKNTPIQPLPELNSQIKTLQLASENKTEKENKILQTLLIVGVPVLLLLGS